MQVYGLYYTVFCTSEGHLCSTVHVTKSFLNTFQVEELDKRVTEMAGFKRYDQCAGYYNTGV